MSKQRIQIKFSLQISTFQFCFHTNFTHRLEAFPDCHWAQTQSFTTNTQKCFLFNDRNTKRRQSLCIACKYIDKMGKFMDIIECLLRAVQWFPVLVIFSIVVWSYYAYVVVLCVCEQSVSNYQILVLIFILEFAVQISTHCLTSFKVFKDLLTIMLFFIRL